MANKAYRINVSGIGGIIFITGLIILGFLALTFFLVFVGIIIGIFLIGFIIRRIMVFLGVKKKREEPVNDYYQEKMIEIPHYEVEDEDKTD